MELLAGSNKQAAARHSASHPCFINGNARWGDAIQLLPDLLWRCPSAAFWVSWAIRITLSPLATVDSISLSPSLVRISDRCVIGDYLLKSQLPPQVSVDLIQGLKESVRLPTIHIHSLSCSGGPGWTFVEVGLFISMHISWADVPGLASRHNLWMRFLWVFWMCVTLY